MFLPINTPPSNINGMSGYQGMGCAGKKSCSCGCGMGMFDSMDFTTWGLPEWASIGGAAYLVLSLIGDTKRAAKGVRRRVRKLRAA